MPNDMLNAFDEYFEVVIADTPELLEQAFRLRYTVLCIEERLPGFEAARYSDGLETDDHDRHSHHLLLKHRPSDTFIGGARLILPDPLEMERPFPAEQYAQIDPALIDNSKLSRQHTAEISRFILVGKYSRRREERRRSESVAVGGKRDPGNRRRFPHPMLAISVGIIRTCIRHGITHWFSVMEPALNRLLGLYQLQLDPVGPLTDYHGPRRPYYAEISKVLERLHTNNLPVWELVTDQGKVLPLSTICTPDQMRKASIIPEPRKSSVLGNLSRPQIQVEESMGK
ncbi:MAG: PEP-CTERM/exosortase system-associated acyltransferase [Nitrosospira sp.]|nr:PEP-CTERM/exosortase system-associated acyltransferase [Nitrosospira sp.]